MASRECRPFEPTQDSSIQKAAAWVSIFYPDVAVEPGEEPVQLAAIERDAASLRLIWLTTLANERLLARSSAARAQIIEALVR
jgi:hypothetical protein